MTSKPRNPKPAADDTRRQDQASHGDAQHRSKKAGHATQLAPARTSRASASAARARAAGTSPALRAGRGQKIARGPPGIVRFRPALGYTGACPFASWRKPA